MDAELIALCRGITCLQHPPDKLESHRVGPNARKHLNQLQHYLDPIVDGLGTGEWDSASGGLLYPSRPRLPGRADEIGAIASRKALTVAWRDECDR